MTWALFIIGILTCAINGMNVMASKGTWRHELIWALSGLCGAGLIALAILFRHWGF